MYPSGVYIVKHFIDSIQKIQTPNRKLHKNYYKSLIVTQCRNRFHICLTIFDACMRVSFHPERRIINKKFYHWPSSVFTDMQQHKRAEYRIFILVIRSELATMLTYLYLGAVFVRLNKSNLNALYIRYRNATFIIQVSFHFAFICIFAPFPFLRRSRTLL